MDNKFEIAESWLETTMSRKNGKDRTVLEKPPRFGLGEHL